MFFLKSEIHPILTYLFYRISANDASFLAKKGGGVGNKGKKRHRADLYNNDLPYGIIT